jgi:hypothetical protein
LRLAITNNISTETNRIEGYNFYLSESRKTGRQLTSEDIVSVRQLINEGHHDMRSMLENIPSNIPLHEDRFEKTTSEAKCVRCEFNELCFEKRA